MHSLLSHHVARAVLALLVVGAAPPLWADTFSCPATLVDSEHKPLVGETVRLRALRNDGEGRPVIEVGNATGQTGGDGTVTVSVNGAQPVHMLRCSAGTADPAKRGKFQNALAVVNEPGDGLPDGTEVVFTPDIAPEPDVTRTFRGLKDGDAEARLYQSGAYDHVIVIPEPFNGGEQGDFGRRTQYDLWRKFEGFLPMFYDLGYDVWVVQARLTNENIHEQAAAVAQAIAQAAVYQGGPVGGKVVVGGFSLAGPVTRIATARWQSDPAWRAALGLPAQVPASLLIFGDAPLRGAQANVTLQRAFWRLGMQNVVSLNSCTAQQLLRSGVSSSSAAPGVNQARFQMLGTAITFEGDGTCDSFDGTTCHCDAGPAVESLGPQQDGWAQGIRKIAFSNGTWDTPTIQCYGDERDRDKGVDLCPLDPGGQGPWTPGVGAVIAHAEVWGSLWCAPIVATLKQVLGEDLKVHADAGDLVGGSRYNGLLNSSFAIEFPICDTVVIFQHFAPVFMPITSTLATDVPYSNGPFDAVRSADHHSVHEWEVPEDTRRWVMDEISAATGGTPPEDEDGNDNVVPHAPSDLTANPVPIGENRVALSWRDRSNNERGFVVYRRRTDELIWHWRVGLGAGVTSFTDEVDVLPQPPDTITFYRYRVQAYNGAGSSAWSDEAEAHMYEPFPFRPITDDPPGCATSVRPRLHWFGANYASSFWVHVSDDETGEHLFDDMFYTKNELVLPFPLTPGHRYSYIVTGRNNLHQGPWSERRYFIPLCTPLTAPVLTEPSGCTTLRPTLDWDPVPGAHGYVVKLREVSTVPGQDDGWVFPPTDLPWAVADQFTLPFDLHAGRDYWFQVKAGDGVNTGGWSGYRYFTAQCGPDSPPGVANPTSPGGAVLTSTPTYRWETGHDATAYRLVVHRRPDFVTVYDATHAAAGNCTVTSCAVTPSAPLPPGSYYFDVQSVNSHGAAPVGPFANFTVPHLPTLTMGDAAVTESAAGDVEAHVRLTLSAPAGPAVHLRWSTVDDTAHAPDDYTAHDEQATIMAGETQLDLVVRVHNDTVHEGPQRFLVRLSDLQGAGATDTEAVVTIVDDDPLPQLTMGDAAYPESGPATGGPWSVPVRLLGQSVGEITATVAFGACTAEADSDFAPNSQVVRFAPGETEKVVELDVFDDSLPEGHEVIAASLSDAQGATVAESAGQVSILNDDVVALPKPARKRSDFDADGNNDIVWQDPSTRALSLWRMVGVNRAETLPFSHLPGAGNWKVVGVADFNGDRKPDLLWGNDDYRSLVFWLMDGVTRVETRIVEGESDPAWKVVATGNFDGDASPDLLWREDQTGNMKVWFMNGVQRKSEAVPTPSHPAVDADQWYAQVADFDGDGKADLLWRNVTAERMVVWLMDGVVRRESRFIEAPSMLGWRVVAAMDVDADGTTDIIWQRDNPDRLVAWLMTGTTLRCPVSMTPRIPDAPGRRVVGPR